MNDKPYTLDEEITGTPDIRRIPGFYPGMSLSQREELGREFDRAREGRKVYRDGMDIVERTLKGLHNAGLIGGFALALDFPERESYDVIGCCAGHMVDMIDPMVMMSSTDVSIQLQLARKLTADVMELQQREAQREAQEGPVTLLDALKEMGFRSEVPAPERPAEGSVEAPGMDGGYL